MNDSVITVTNDFRAMRDDAEGVILDKQNNRFFNGKQLADHEYVEDGLVMVGELPPEPEKAPTKTSGERKKRVTFTDITDALKETADATGVNLWAVDAQDGIKVVRDQEVVKTFSGDNKKINSILLWIEGVTDTLLTITPAAEVA